MCFVVSSIHVSLLIRIDEFIDCLDLFLCTFAIYLPILLGFSICNRSVLSIFSVIPLSLACTLSTVQIYTLSSSMAY